jgi:COMPASS component SWD2
MDLKSSVKQQTSTTLSKDLLQSYGAGRVFKYNSDINSMDFRADGEVMVVSSVDDSLQVYDVNQGKLTKTTFAKRYGVGVVRFTHHPNAVICASNNDWGDDAIRYIHSCASTFHCLPLLLFKCIHPLIYSLIVPMHLNMCNHTHLISATTIRYLSLYDNRYLRYFKGHKAKVVALEMSPCDDTFISGSLDSTIRLWDIRSNVCQGFISLPERARGRPAVAFDPMGLCFAIATGDNFVKLFDVKSYDKGPFANFKVEGPPITIMSLSFSPDGQHLLLSTDTDQVCYSFHYRFITCFSYRVCLLIVVSD